MTCAQRRHNNVKKAIHKRNISRAVYGMDWYNNLHQYSDNKIHCSCNLCRFRPVWDPNNKPISDVKKEASMKYKLDEYLAS